MQCHTKYTEDHQAYSLVRKRMIQLRTNNLNITLSEDTNVSDHSPK